MFSLALREVGRAKLRFGLLCAAVGLLVFLILFQQALLNGLVKDFIGAVENQDSPILVFNEQARSNVEGSFLLPDQVAAIAAVDGVADSTPIGENTFTVATAAGAETQDAVLFGYSLGGLGEPTRLDGGRLPAAPFEVVATSADAALGFDIGEQVTVLGETDDVVLTVVGSLDQSRWSVAPTLFGSYETFEAAARVVNPNAPFVLPALVAVRPASGVDADELTDRLDAEVGGIEALTNAEAVAQNPGVQGVSQSFNIILGLAFVVVTIVVGFFFLILTVQKARSLTLLRAIGAPRGWLVRNLMAQIALVMAVGALIGVILSALVIYVAPTGDLTISLNPVTVISTILGLSILAYLGGIASIRRVLRIDPIEAVAGTG